MSNRIIIVMKTKKCIGIKKIGQEFHRNCYAIKCTFYSTGAFYQ